MLNDGQDASFDGWIRRSQAREKTLDGGVTVAKKKVVKKVAKKCGRGKEAAAKKVAKKKTTKKPAKKMAKCCCK